MGCTEQRAESQALAAGLHRGHEMCTHVERPEDAGREGHRATESCGSLGGARWILGVRAEKCLSPLSVCALSARPKHDSSFSVPSRPMTLQILG